MACKILPNIAVELQLMAESSMFQPTSQTDRRRCRRGGLFGHSWQAWLISQYSLESIAWGSFQSHSLVLGIGRDP